MPTSLNNRCLILDRSVFFCFYFAPMCTVLDGKLDDVPSADTAVIVQRAISEGGVSRGQGVAGLRPATHHPSCKSSFTVPESLSGWLNLSSPADI